MSLDSLIRAALPEACWTHPGEAATSWGTYYERGERPIKVAYCTPCATAMRAAGYYREGS